MIATYAMQMYFRYNAKMFSHTFLGIIFIYIYICIYYESYLFMRINQYQTNNSYDLFTYIPDIY